MTAKPRILVLSGYGINCEEETAFAFEKAGGAPTIVHLNDLIDKKTSLGDFQILMFPGGFSYGDDTGSGNALANRIRNHLWDEVLTFVAQDKLCLGICNGFQVMVNLGLLPAFETDFGKRQVALVHNDSARYIDRWVDLKFASGGIWTSGIGTISLPIAHGEGKFFADSETLQKLEEHKMIACSYFDGEICQKFDLLANPNGSLKNIAGIADSSGRLMGMMPHPERAIAFTHRPDWTFLQEKYQREGKPVSDEYSGLQIFRNGVKYFS